MIFTTLLTTLLPSLFALARPKIASIVGKDKVDLVLGAITQSATDNQSVLDNQLKAIADSDANQSAINLADAKSGNLWQAGWRPACGWIGAIGFAWATIGIYVANFYLTLQELPLMEPMDTSLLLFILSGMLGLGVLRSIEKNNIRKK